MRRANPAFLAVFLVWVAVSTTAAALLKGALFTRGYEGDTLHLLDIVTRIGAGQWPHLDFTTPLGAFSVLPIVLFQRLGLDFGPAVLAGQGLVAALVLPAVFWASWTRLPRFWAYFFGGTMIAMVTAIVHGGGDLGISISMHYNRWAWAIGLSAVLVALLPGEEGDRPGPDGAVIGLGLSALALIKATYVAAFAPAILVVLLMRRAYRTLAVALVLSALSAGAVFVLAGADYVWAYIADLRAVAGSGTRPMPGQPFFGVLTQPVYFGGTIALLAAVVILRRGPSARLGTALLIFFPAFAYVTYQNFGNDPVWLVLLAAVLFAEAARIEAGGGTGRALQMAAIAGFMVIAPTLFNFSVSTLRHLATPLGDKVEMLAYLPRPPGVTLWAPRANYGVAQVDLADTQEAFASYRGAIEGRDPVVFKGELLPRCTMMSGLNAQLEETAKGLRAAGLGPEDGIFTADIIQSVWLYGPFAPLRNGGPWYYAGLPGFEDAEYLLVPACPMSIKVWTVILGEIETRAIPLEEVERTDLYRLYRIVR